MELAPFGTVVDHLLFVGGDRHGERELHIAGWFYSVNWASFVEGTASMYDRRAKVILTDHRLYLCWVHSSVPKDQKDKLLKATVEELHGPGSVLNWGWAKYGSKGDFFLAVPKGEKKETPW